MAQVEPIIVLGMHRSGTTLVSRLMQGIGIYMGLRKDTNNEARFFQRINAWLLETAGGRWDAPGAWEYALDDDELRSLYASYLRSVMSSPLLTEYLRPGDYLKYRKLERVDFSWGWKDPRNTLTLPVWLQALSMPARIIHVRRHGVDVAHSLFTRQSRARETIARSFRAGSRLASIYWLRPMRGDHIDSTRCSRMDGAFSLWVEYLDFFERRIRPLQVPLLDLTYERVLEDPRTELTRVAAFCGVRPTEVEIDTVIGSMRSERAYAYRSSPESVEFAQRHSETLARYGYSMECVHFPHDRDSES